MPLPNLVEVDSLEVQVIVDNELDPLSPCPHPDVQAPSRFMGIPLAPVNTPSSRGGAKKEFRMDNICCGAHGLSLMIVSLWGAFYLVSGISPES